MSSELVRRVSDNAGIVKAGGSRVPRAVVKAVEGAAHRGLASAAKVQAAGYVTHVAVSQVASLSREEALLIETVPAADPVHKERVASRLRLMVDNYTGVAADEIARLGY